jgi:hypothetical protein
MIAIPLTIVMHGLVALVPTNAPGGAHHMTALMVEARMPPALQCLAPHHPQLVFDVANEQDCTNAGCMPSGFMCTCTDVLAGKQITLEFQPTHSPTGTLQVKPPATPFPTAATVTDFSYVANLTAKPYKATLDPRFLTDAPPAGLLARMEFDFDAVAACNLFGREDEGKSQVVSMTSRKLHARGRTGESNQALAQMVMATLDVPAAGASPLVLRLHSFNNQPTEPDLTFTLRSGGANYRIDLSNDTDPLPPDDPCDDGVARHFGLFYTLAANPPAPADWRVPHAKVFAGKVIPMPSTCMPPDFNPMDRPACPMATFDPVNPNS